MQIKTCLLQNTVRMLTVDQFVKHLTLQHFLFYEEKEKNYSTVTLTPPLTQHVSWRKVVINGTLADKNTAKLLQSCTACCSYKMVKMMRNTALFFFFFSDQSVQNKESVFSKPFFWLQTL